MKIQILTIALIACTALIAEEKKVSGAFLDSHPAEEANRFGIVQAEALADAQRIQQVGTCGMVIFKEKKGPFWIFQTKVGYAGMSGPYIIITDPSAQLPAFAAKLQEPKEWSQSPSPSIGYYPPSGTDLIGRSSDRDQLIKEFRSRVEAKSQPKKE